MQINDGESDSRLSGYWAMNEEQRRERNTVLLNVACATGLSAEERKNRLETLLLHTLHGKVITMQLLEESEYADCKEQLHSVLQTLGEREERIYLLRDETGKVYSPVTASSHTQES